MSSVYGMSDICLDSYKEDFICYMSESFEQIVGTCISICLRYEEYIEGSTSVSMYGSDSFSSYCSHIYEKERYRKFKHLSQGFIYNYWIENNVIESDLVESMIYEDDTLTTNISQRSMEEFQERILGVRYKGKPLGRFEILDL